MQAPALQGNKENEGPSGPSFSFKKVITFYCFVIFNVSDLLSSLYFTR